MINEMQGEARVDSKLLHVCCLNCLDTLMCVCSAAKQTHSPGVMDPERHVD